MTREELIRNLKYTMEKHKNDTVDTFGTNISVMCKDILDYLEQEPSRDIEEIKEIINCDADAETKCKMISNILTAKPHYFEKQEPKTGHWIFDKERLGYWISTCSECEHIFHGNEMLIYKPKFCANCGAKMVKSQESEGEG